jgi:hypothetical protein
VTATADTKELGVAASDVELQGRHSSSLEASSRDVLEVRLLNATKVARLTEPCAEVHQPVLRNLLQHHCALLVGRNGLNFPICTAQWWAFSLALRMHSRRLWRDCSGLLYGGNGLHVRKTVPATRSSLTSCRDPVIGAQYRWSANFAPFAPRFWGLTQGGSDAPIARLECSYASRMADCQCLDHQLRRSSRGHCQQYHRPRSIPL